jgi:hypothetical protein
MTREQIALALQQQQQRRGQPLGSPFAPAQVPLRQPAFAGTPAPPVAAATPQYGFNTGFNAAIGPATADAGKGASWKDLYNKLFGEDAPS